MDTFIESNALELAKDKWLCPLSGKKFRAKEFVIKHIHNKHSDKLKAVRLEVSRNVSSLFHSSFSTLKDLPST